MRQEYIIGTEAGMIHRLSTDVPGKRYYLATEATVCPTMKMTTLRKAIEALRAEGPVVTVPADMREKALRARAAHGGDRPLDAGVGVDARTWWPGRRRRPLLAATTSWWSAAASPASRLPWGRRASGTSPC